MIKQLEGQELRDWQQKVILSALVQSARNLVKEISSKCSDGTLKFYTQQALSHNLNVKLDEGKVTLR